MSGFGGFGSTPASGGLFGAKPPESGFSAPANTTTGLTFGTGSPAFGAAGTGTPAFGATGTGTPAFGAAGTGTPAFGATGTGTPAFGTTGLYGTTPAASTFGASSSILSTPSTATTSTAGFKFGAATTATTGFTFGGATTATTGLTFGTPTTTTTGLTFGTAATTGLTFGAATTSTTGITFKPTTTTMFGTPSTTSTIGTGLSFNLPKTTGSFLSTPTTSTTTTSLSFTFGTQNPTTSSLASGAAQTTTSQATGFTFSQQGSSFSFGAPKTATGKPDENAAKAPGTPGLGGVDKSQLNQGLSGTGTTEPNQVKDNILPDQILQTLNDFQNFTKQQKSISVEISHGSSKPLKKVQEDTEVMESLLTVITSGLTRNALAVDKLKTETAQGLHQAEMAQRNHETPPGLEYDSTAPAEYFNDLVTKFETDTMRIRVQIEASEKHLRSLTQSTSISPQELTLAMRRLHETLVVLAARVQTLHTTVQSQKEQYRNLRRVYLKDDSAIFEKEKDHQQSRKQTIFSLHSLTGPTPFSETTGSGRPLNVDGLAMLNDSTVTSMISTTTANRGWMTPLSASAGTGAVLAPTNTLQTSQPCDTTGFQLSKPPTGNKRNKR